MPELTTAEKLAEAKSALHTLLVKKRSVSLAHGDQRIEYRNFAGDIEQLRIYIRDLEQELAVETGAPAPRRAFGVNFGGR